MEEKESSGLLKKLFVGGTFALTIGCTRLPTLEEAQVTYAPPGYVVSRKTTRANRALLRYRTADQINKEAGRPVVRSVNKYLVPGAKKVLVHWLLDHYLLNMSEEDEKEVLANQQDFKKGIEITGGGIYNGESLTSDYEIRSMFSFRRFCDRLFADIIRDLKKQAEVLDRQLSESYENEDELRKAMAETEERIAKFQRWQGDGLLLGADRQLAYEGKIRLLPGELPNKEADEMTKELRKGKKIEYDKYQKVIFEEREDGSVVVAAGRRGIIQNFGYGGKHAFGGKESCGPDYSLEGRVSKKDNIAEWNKLQMLLPEKERVILSLIEITLSHYNR